MAGRLLVRDHLSSDLEDYCGLLSREDDMKHLPDLQGRSRAETGITVVTCGFPLKGLLRKHQYHDGEWKDRVAYGLLADDWRR